MANNALFHKIILSYFKPNDVQLFPLVPLQQVEVAKFNCRQTSSLLNIYCYDPKN